MMVRKACLDGARIGRREEEEEFEHEQQGFGEIVRSRLEEDS